MHLGQARGLSRFVVSWLRKATSYPHVWPWSWFAQAALIGAYPLVSAERLPYGGPVPEPTIDIITPSPQDADAIATVLYQAAAAAYTSIVPPGSCGRWRRPRRAAVGC
jgi:hypothetical protein